MTMISVLLLSCAEKQPEPVIAEPEPLPFEFDENLQDIDTLLQTDAGDALQKLLSFDTQSVIFNDNYHKLLLSEALYKTDNPQLNRFRNETFQETSLQDAMHYFDSLAAQYPADDDLAILAARSHYMNGVGFYESDSIVEACKEYLHTLEIMENHFDVEKLRGYRAKFMGLTYTRLGEIFFNYGMARPALDSYKNALIHFLKLPNYSVANTYRFIGYSYFLDQHTDSALYYYRKAIDLAKKQNKITVYSSSLAEAAPLYYETGYIDSAFLMIREALTLPMNDDQRLKRYYILGTFFAKECVYDSAVFYLEKSVNSNSYATQTVSADILTNCYQALGDTAKAQYYKMIYGENFSKYRNNLDISTELSQIYDIYKQNQLQKEHIKYIKKRNRNIIISFSLILTLTIALVILIRNKIITIKKKSHDDLEEKDKALAAMKRRIEANPFMNEPICTSIWAKVNQKQFKSKVPCTTYKEYALSKEQLLALREAIDRHYDNFTQWIIRDYPKLTDDDIDYCCLFFLGLKCTDVFVLMQRAYPTIVERSRKLTRIFNSNKSLPTTIKNIIESHINN